MASNRHQVGHTAIAAVKLAAGGFAFFAGAQMADAFGESAQDAYQNAGIAAEHALVDGGASKEGYFGEHGGLAHQLTNDQDRSTVPAPSPAPVADPGAAVTADQTMASVMTAIGDQNMETQRWVFGGVAAVVLIAVRGAYRSFSRALDAPSGPEGDGEDAKAPGGAAAVNSG